jgi:hypothetical protein
MVFKFEVAFMFVVVWGLELSFCGCVSIAAAATLGYL